MWHTDCGDRTLDGAEARLFAEALWDFVSELEGDEDDLRCGTWERNMQTSSKINNQKGCV